MALLNDPDGRRWLLVVAAPKEARAVSRGIAGREFEPGHWALTPMGERFDLLLSGVGKANAAGATARAIDLARHAGVINLGIAGVLSDTIVEEACGVEVRGSRTVSSRVSARPLEIGEVVVASESVFADEGSVTPDGFIDIARLGFPPIARGAAAASVSVRCDEKLVRALVQGFTKSAPVATVSACSGTDAAAREIARRTGAAAEAMEGAAVGLATWRVGGAALPFAEVRVISNTTGDRAAQRWDLRLALERLAEAAAAL